MLRWGLVPSWARDPKFGRNLINARAETVAERPALRDAFHRRPCLIAADGLYQWAHRGTKKRPYQIRRRNGSLVAIAGLWESGIYRFGESAETCCVITTASPAPLLVDHDRMPAVIDPADFGRWLDPNERPRELANLLRPDAAATFEAIPASPLVNNTACDGPYELSPVEPSQP